MEAYLEQQKAKKNRRTFPKFLRRNSKLGFLFQVRCLGEDPLGEYSYFRDFKRTTRQENLHSQIQVQFQSEIQEGVKGSYL